MNLGFYLFISIFSFAWFTLSRRLEKNSLLNFIVAFNILSFVHGWYIGVPTTVSSHILAANSKKSGWSAQKSKILNGISALSKSTSLINHKGRMI